MRILLVEDDVALADSLGDALAEAGHSVHSVRTGHGALHAPAPDLVLLDLGLPDVDGRDVCRRLRERSAVPIIIMSGRADEIDRVLGLELGADDYVTKPFAVRELVARVRAVGRRCGQRASVRVTVADPVDRQRQRIGDLVIDRAERRLEVDGREVVLTAPQFDLLAHLARDPGALVRRADVLDHAWRHHGLPPRAVDGAVASLRRKVGDAVTITAVRGVGFRLDGPM